MNDKDLERQLRSQRGPREEGYVPSQLPMALETDSGTRPRTPWLLRAAVFVPAAVAGVLAVGVVSGVLNGTEPGPGSNETATPSASPSASSSAVASNGRPVGCQPSEVALSAEPWGGAAGSRGTVVTISKVGTGNLCSLPSGVGAQITDIAGTTVVSQESENLSPKVHLLPPRLTGSAQSAGYTVGVAWSNWCADQPAGPLSLALLFPGWDSPTPVTVADGGVSPVPPCMGDGESNLSVTDLQPQD